MTYKNGVVYGFFLESENDTTRIESLEKTEANGHATVSSLNGILLYVNMEHSSVISRLDKRIHIKRINNKAKVVRIQQ